MKCTLILITLGLSSFFQIAGSQESIVDNTDFNKFLGKEIVLRPISTNVSYFYLNNEYNSYYRLFDDRRFLYRNKQLVSITDISFGNSRKAASQYDRSRFDPDSVSYLKVTYENQLLGKQTLQLRAGNIKFISKETFYDFFEKVFILDTASDNFKNYAVNETNRIVHSALSNHLLSTERYAFKSELSPDDSNHLCYSCFQDIQRIDDLSFELYIGRQVSDYFLSYNRISKNDSLQLLVDSIGQSVLDKWPLPKKGYKYEFYPVVNMSLNAFACPGGIIYVYEGLLHSLDNSKELTSVLAHEIAHIEFRHGYRQYKSAQKSALWSSIAAAAVGTIVATTTDNANTQVAAYAISASIIDLFANIILSGYSRQYELEADRVAEFYLGSTGPNEKIYFENVLNKLVYLSDEDPSDNSSSTFASHPPLSQRMNALKNSQIFVYPEKVSYRGYDELGNLVATFSILGHKQVSKGYVDHSINTQYQNDDTLNTFIIYTELKLTEFLKDPCEAKHFSVKGVRSKFENKEDTKVFPLSETAIMFYFQSQEEVNFYEINELTFNLNNIKIWKK